MNHPVKSTNSIERYNCVEALSGGDKIPEGFQQKDNHDRRTFNQNFYGQLTLKVITHANLKRPLADCIGQPTEGIQIMLFSMVLSIPYIKVNSI